jgi:hypothetical protein
MDNTIERIKKRIEDVQSKLDRSVFCDYDNAKYDGYECALIIIDEELAKEPQEEPNIPLECVDGSCPIALSEEYAERGVDIVHSCAECQYQPQVQLIVRTPEEVVEMLNKISCNECDKNSSHCHFSEKDCKNYWFDWLTGKQV